MTRTRELEVDQSFHLVKRFELCDVGWMDCARRPQGPPPTVDSGVMFSIQEDL